MPSDLHCAQPGAYELLEVSDEELGLFGGEIRAGQVCRLHPEVEKIGGPPPQIGTETTGGDGYDGGAGACALPQWRGGSILVIHRK